MRSTSGDSTDLVRFIVCEFVVLVFLCSVTRAQVVLRDHLSGSSVGNFGYQICTLGDVNGDGRSDYAISSPNEPIGGSSFCGRIDVFSGLTGAALYSLFGSANERLGESMDGGADLNGDGIRDIVTTHRIALYNYGVRIHSGATGLLISTLPLPFGTNHQVFWVRSSNLDGVGLGEIVVADVAVSTISILTPSGVVLATLNGPSGAVLPSSYGGIIGDINQDGIADVVSGVGPATMTPPVAYSGANGTVLQTFSLPVGNPAGFISTPGDLDADQVPDVIFQAGLGSTVAGGFVAFSGATGNQIWAIPPELSFQSGFGIPARHVAIADVSGDGRGELVVAASSCCTWLTGSVFVYSGSTGQRLFAVRGDGPFFASHLGNVGDVDGDGRDEVVEGNYDFNGSTTQLDKASVISFTQVPSNLASAAILGIGCRNPAGLEPILSVSNQPVLGSTVTLSVNNAPMNTLGTLVVTFDWPSSFSIPGTCITIWPNITLPWSLVSFLSSNIGEWNFNLGIPSDPGLIGFRLTLQAAYPATTTPLPSVTNGLQLYLGN